MFPQHSTGLRTIALACTAALAAITLSAVGTPAAQAAGSLSAASLSSGTTANDLGQSLVGSGVTISNIVFDGAPAAAGLFSGGADSIGINEGVVLSTGSVATAAGTEGCLGKGIEAPNACTNASTENGTAGDDQLDEFAGVSTLDAAVLSFDFVPSYSTIQFEYVFASEEYSEYANTRFNDTFAFFVNGKNCATVPGTSPSQPVSINTINGGNPTGTNPQNPSYYRDNESGTLATELDGLTVRLTCSANVLANETNTLRLAIADGSDRSLDSAVFIAADSLVSGTTITPSLSGSGATGTTIVVPANSAVTASSTLGGSNAATAKGTVTYRSFTNSTCTTALAPAQTVTVTNGVVPNASPVTVGGAGTYYFTVSYSGDATHSPAASSCGLATAKVEAAAPAVATSLKAAPILGTVPALSLVVVRATLTRTSNGKPIAGQTVTFSAGSTTLCSAKTNASGVAACTSPIKRLQALVSLRGYTARFDGTSKLLASTAAAPIIVLFGVSIP